MGCNTGSSPVQLHLVRNRPPKAAGVFSLIIGQRLGRSGAVRVRSGPRLRGGRLYAA